MGERLQRWQCDCSNGCNVCLVAATGFSVEIEIGGKASCDLNGPSVGFPGREKHIVVVVFCKYLQKQRELW